MKTILSLLLCVWMCSCVVSKGYRPNQKIPREATEADYSLFQSILEEDHPGIYWYTPKDSMDYYFEKGRSMLRDSMTEPQFKNVLSYVLSKIRCGHTTTRSSRQYEKGGDTIRNRFFPLVLKLWPDTAIITQNLNRRDSIVTRGSILTAIDGRPMQQIVDSLFQYLSTDGYNLTHKYQTLSNRGAFGSSYTAVFGTKPRYTVNFIDTLGKERTGTVSAYALARDTSRRTPLPMPKPSRKERRKLALTANRNLRIDTALNTAFMELNTFTKSGKLRPFFRQTFKKLRKESISNLVIDLRSNGGGSVTMSNLLTKYISDHRFKIADSLFTVARKTNYRQYQQSAFWNKLFMMFFTHKRSDGAYHFSWFEERYFRPRVRNHFSGNTYILNGGNTFSASTLVAEALRLQANVTLIGEETGGGAYGNNAWLIPDITLPKTGVRFRLPQFRLVIDKDQPKGYGVQPEVFAGPSVQAIRQNRDYKTEAVVQLLQERKDTCIEAMVTYGGDPRADGLGWVLKVADESRTFIVGDALPEAYRSEGKKVNACVYKTGGKVPCHCVSQPDAYAIRSISNR
ncbi:MAG: hypothetical protein JWP88_1501 [Flaviaesturariibacter sp.]|nr:hypothetical protein [Flaviaesturariibacter sp.]